MIYYPLVIYMIMQILKTYFGYDKLKEEQERIINNVIKRKDTIGLLPTGFGKSLTFQIPALMFSGVTIVITPLITLMQDQVINLKEFSTFLDLNEDETWV